MNTQTAPAVLPGILFVWTNVDPDHEADFNQWYDREHVAERVRLPGFVSGTRYHSVSGPRRYLGLYRTTSLDAFRTEEYFAAFQRQTPWSVANLARMREPMRRVCTIEAESGFGTGAWLAVLRLGSSALGVADQVASLGTQLLAIDGIIGSRLLTPDVTLSTPLPAEDRVGRVLDPILLIEASSEAALREAAAVASARIDGSIDDCAFLQLSWQLREQDLAS